MEAKIQIHAQLTKLWYEGKRMQVYVGSFDYLFSRLSGVNCSIDEDMQVTMIFS